MNLLISQSAENSSELGWNGGASKRGLRRALGSSVVSIDMMSKKFDQEIEGSENGCCRQTFKTIHEGSMLEIATCRKNGLLATAAGNGKVLYRVIS